MDWVLKYLQGKVVNQKNSRGFFADQGFDSLLSFAARKKWLQDKENADYVKALGFDANSYKGSAAQNHALLGMLQAKQMLDNDALEQARELEELKQQNDGVQRLEAPVQEVAPARAEEVTSALKPKADEASLDYDIHPFKNVYDYRKFSEDENFPMRKETELGTLYFAASAAVNPNTGEVYEATATPRNDVSLADMALARRDWITENIDNPDVLFDPKYAKTRQAISNREWAAILKAHPEYEVRYNKQIPTNIQTGRMQGAINRAQNEAAPYALQMLSLAANPLAAGASIVGGIATDEATRSASNGKYTSWGNMVNSNVDLGSDLANNLVGTVTNPGALAGAIAGGFATGGTGNVGKTSVTTTRTVRPATAARTIEVPAQQGRWIASGSSKQVGLANSRDVIPNEVLYQSGYNVTHRLPIRNFDPNYTRAAYSYVRPGRPAIVETQTHTIGGTGARAGFDPGYGWLYLNTPSSMQRGIRPSDIPYGQREQVWFPHNTAYDWGSGEFQEWWRNNAPGNEGKTLLFNGRPVRISYSPNGYRGRNFLGGVDAGLYPSGQKADRRVLNVLPVTYTGQPIGYKQVGVTPVTWQTLPQLEGSIEPLKGGGQINYQKIFK